MTTLDKWKLALDIVSNLIVPFVALYTAAWLASRDADRREARELFGHLSRHVQQFCHAIMRLRRTDEVKEQVMAETTRQVTLGLPVTSALPADWDGVRQEQALELGARMIDIENDRVALAMRYGEKKSDRLSRGVWNLSLMAKAYLEENGGPLPPRNTFFEIVERKKNEVFDALHLLVGSKATPKPRQPEK